MLEYISAAWDLKFKEYKKDCALINILGNQDLNKK